MTRVFNLDSCDEGDEDIRVFIPGPAGPPSPIVDVGTRLAPALVTTALIAPVHYRQRSFIQGSVAPVSQPTLPNGTNGVNVQEWYLFVTSDANSITLNDASNLELSGQWIGTNGSMICLQWDNISKWVEAHRNEI